MGSRGGASPRFEVREWHGELLRCFQVVAGQGCAVEVGDAMIDAGVVWREPGFVVRATELDHGTPVLAYAFEPRARINVCRDRLQALGVPTGPWLQELKREYLAGNHRHVIVLPDGSRASVEQLKEQVLLSSPGEKLVYAISIFPSATSRMSVRCIGNWEACAATP